MPYHDNDELERIVEQSAARAGGRAELFELGRTVEGRSIPAVTFTAPATTANPGRPQVIITGNVHGNEVIGSELALALIERLAADEPEPKTEALLALADATVVPAVNLDSRAIAVRAALERRLWCKAPRGNANGVDLNRNFPFPKGTKDVWHPLSGTTVSWLPWFRGPEPLSEPEARALAELAGRLRPAGIINLHSVSRKFLYPYGYSHREPADVDLFLAMGEAYVSAQPERRYSIRQSRSWYAILGDMDDYFYDAHGSLSVTVELSQLTAGVGLNPLRLLCPFAMMNPPSPEPTIRNNAEACLHALAEAVRLRSARPTSKSSFLPKDATVG